MIIETKNSKETIDVGKRIGKLFQAGDVVALMGELGSGKTTFTQGLTRGLGVGEKDYVSSPSFTLIKEYKGRLPVYHIDLYRLNDIREVYDLGYEEYFYGKGVTIIEWGGKIKKLLPKETLIINLEIIGENKRRIELQARGKKYQSVVKALGRK
jgi:tRNA threonylcarbamoyladenosine biosynthesis protein TsaE